MSECINNREYRQKVLKGLIRELHEGKSVEDVKSRFGELIQGVSTTEITEMEQALISEGMPVGEIQRLCDVHAAVFKGSIDEIHAPQKEEEIPGHPIHTFKLENREIENLIRSRIYPHIESFIRPGEKAAAGKLIDDFGLFAEIGRHYTRKENLLFPYLEKYGITAPPKVMWGVDDEIRDTIKEVIALLKNDSGNIDLIVRKAQEAVRKASEMIYKEENILFPMAVDTLSQDEWIRIERESRDLGYCLIKPQTKWNPVSENREQMAEAKAEAEHSGGNVEFDAGSMTPEELNSMLNTLPFDITFVDKNDRVKYFTWGKDRIFARPKAVLGREVTYCHPPASVHIVQGIVDDFKSGRKDHEDFWIRLGDKYVYIRYYAVRNKNGEYLGTMEVTQDIRPIQEITSERRLMTQ